MNAQQYLDKGRGMGNITTNLANTLSSAVANATAPKPTVWGSISNFLTNVSNTVTKAAPIVSNVQQTVNAIKSGQPVQQQTQTGFNPNQPQPQPGMSTGKKVLIGTGIAAAAALTYFVFKPSKKK